MNKQKRHNRGQMRIIETILASFIILAALAFTSSFVVTPTNPKYDITELQKLGYNVLHDLDMQGLLARYVYTEQWDEAKAALRVMLPIDVYFSLEVQNIDGTTVNDAPIVYGDSATIANSKDIASITYGLPGYPTKITATNYQANYDPRILTLQLVRG